MTYQQLIGFTKMPFTKGMTREKLIEIAKEQAYGSAHSAHSGDDSIRSPEESRSRIPGSSSNDESAGLLDGGSQERRLHFGEETQEPSDPERSDTDQG
jgi:hypothetical protein